MNLAASLAVLTTPRTINGTTSTRIGDKSLAQDGEEIRKVTRKVTTVAPVTLDPQTALALIVLKAIAAASLRNVEAAKAFSLDPASATMSQAEAADALHAILSAPTEANGPARVVDQEALEDARNTCANQVQLSIQQGALKAYKAFGPQCLSILATVREADCAAIVASMTAARTALAAKAQAEADKAAKAKQAEADKLAKAAARKAALAKPAAVAKPKQLPTAQQAQVAARMAAA